MTTPTPAPAGTPTAAVRARTIVAGCHLAEALGPRTGPRHVGMMDVGGSPVILAVPSTPVPHGEVHLLCRTVHAEAGTVLVTGTCAPPTTALAVPGLLDELRAHSECLVPHMRDATHVLARLTAVPVAVTAVALAGGGEPVPVADYLAARADEWSVHGESIRVHLEADHQDQLRTLVRRSQPDVRAVAVASLSPDELQLVGLGDSGTASVSVRIDPELTTPAALGSWLSTALAG